MFLGNLGSSLAILEIPSRSHRSRSARRRRSSCFAFKRLSGLRCSPATPTRLLSSRARSSRARSSREPRPRSRRPCSPVRASSVNYLVLKSWTSMNSKAGLHDESRASRREVAASTGAARRALHSLSPWLPRRARVAHARASVSKAQCLLWRWIDPVAEHALKPHRLRVYFGQRRSQAMFEEERS